VGLAASPHVGLGAFDASGGRGRSAAPHVEQLDRRGDERRRPYEPATAGESYEAVKRPSRTSGALRQAQGDLRLSKVEAASLQRAAEGGERL
jgi:hypothetical protein